MISIDCIFHIYLQPNIYALQNKRYSLNCMSIVYLPIMCNHDLISLTIEQNEMIVNFKVIREGGQSVGDIFIALLLRQGEYQIQRIHSNR